MRLEQTGPGTFCLTLHGYELASLTAAARLVAEGGDPSVTPEALGQLRQTLEAYDAAAARMADPSERADGT